MSRSVVAAAFASAVLFLAGAPAVAAGPPDPPPNLAVALGDSIASGEGAGDYYPDTDTTANNCHRSRLSAAALAGLGDAFANLACSGAKAENLQLGGQPLNGEAPQVEQLRNYASRYKISFVLVTVGANDMGFHELAGDCVRAYYVFWGASCRSQWTDRLDTRLTEVGTRLAKVLGDIRSVLPGTAYQLIVQSYPSPLTGENRYPAPVRALEGCPFRLDDAAWTRDTVVPKLAATMRAAAEGAGARFLDLSAATRGHEVCAVGVGHEDEWVHGLRMGNAYDPEASPAPVPEGLFQESLHPNRLGHERLGGCLREFAALTTDAACVPAADGRLHPQVVPVP